MAVVYTNNASTSLSSGIDSSTTSITVGSVADFPTLTGSDYYYATIANTTNTKIEIVKVTAASGTTLTVVRGQDDTTATNFDSGDNFQIRVTSATLDSATKSDVDISGGEIDGTPIGANSASTGAFTTVSATGNITVGGTVDGRDIATDGTKLDGIETGATADQSASEIKTAYESNSDTNAFTDAEKTKLSGIEASADVTDTANVVAALTAGTNITIAGDGTISATDTDTGILNVVEDTTPQLGGDLDTNGNDVNFGDNDKAQFGASNDLQIYHDGSKSVIQDAGTGNLNIQSSASINLLNANSTAYLARFFDGGAVTLYYNNSVKLDTTSTGVDVTGTVEMDTLSIGGTAVTATAAELNYVDGVTSNIQTQLNAKQASGSYAVTTNNLSDLSSASTARTNLGLGSLATLSAVGAAQITDNTVGAAELNVSGNGTSGQSLVSDGDGTFSWADAGGGSYSNIQVFNSSGTWNYSSAGSPSKVLVYATGGGGGGGQCQGGGGGGGGTSIGIVSVNGNVSVTVGNGGNGASAYFGNNSNSGNASNFGGLVTGNGGSGANTGTGGGGNGSGGQLNFSGRSGFPRNSAEFSRGGYSYWHEGQVGLTPKIINQNQYGFNGRSGGSGQYGSGGGSEANCADNGGGSGGTGIVVVMAVA